MAKVKSHGNKSTELRFITLCKTFHIKGWRRNYKSVGNPDFVFLKQRYAIFIDGCFWHGCPLHCRVPTTNIEYWVSKIESNVTRDKLINEKLTAKGWIIIRIWEHQLLLKNGNELKEYMSQYFEGMV
jgi:DNA mismatch endonuclease (patch repair protein)